MRSRYHFYCAVLVLLGAILVSPSVSFAQRYPSHFIQLIIPNVAGSVMDVTARLLASELEKYIDTRIIPNNKPGASMVLGTDLAVRAKKDGYTLLYGVTSALMYVPITNPEIVTYDPSKDLEPLGLHCLLANAVAVRSDSPWKTFSELIAYAKKNPKELRVSTTGIASGPHFILEMIQAMTGAQFTHVPFKGGDPIVTAVLGGHVEVACDAFARIQPHMETGKLRALLITNKMPDYPNIPTTTDLGYKQGLPSAWFAVYAPAGIPEEVRKLLVPAIEKAVNGTKTKIDQMGNLVEYKSPLELKKIWEEEYKQIYETAVKMGLREP
jgi:tripartite-type tricarboxylate transporter receptor subunit TctC